MQDQNAPRVPTPEGRLNEVQQNALEEYKNVLVSLRQTENQINALEAQRASLQDRADAFERQLNLFGGFSQIVQQDAKLRKEQERIEMAKAQEDGKVVQFPGTNDEVPPEE